MTNKIFIFISILLVSFLLNQFIPSNIINDIIEKTIFSIVPVILGTTIAIAGIFLSSTSTIYISIYKIIKNKEQNIFSDVDIDEIKNKLKDIVNELKQNSILSLSCFIAILLLYYFKYINLPFFMWLTDNPIYTKNYAINGLIFVLVGLIIWSIYDSLLAIFKINEAFKLFKTK